MAGVALFFCTAVLLPRSARAGFFDSFIRWFGGNNAGASADTAGASVSQPLLGSDAPSVSGGARAAADEKTADAPPLPATQDNALISTKNPAGTLPRSGSDHIVVYAVQDGDTPGTIAEHFGISLNTLLWANNIKSAKNIRVGDDLIILPVTGVQYAIKKGDTPESIAKKFKADAGDIIGFNGLAVDEPLEIGSAIIIPDGEMTPSPGAPSLGKTPSRFAGLPEFVGYYMRPIMGGRNSRVTRANPHGIHGYNGVDLANSCSLPIFASADGTVIIARESGWNSGYGKYVVITHPNNTQTLYGHMSVVMASAGQEVLQGTQIGEIGSTGNSTGCHIHFEIRGAKNPF